MILPKYKSSTRVSRSSFWNQGLRGCCKCKFCFQWMSTIYNKMLKISTGRRQTSWLYYKRGQGIELQLVIRAELKLRTSGFQFSVQNAHEYKASSLELNR